VRFSFYNDEEIVRDDFLKSAPWRLLAFNAPFWELAGRILGTVWRRDPTALASPAHLTRLSHLQRRIARIGDVMRTLSRSTLINQIALLRAEIGDIEGSDGHHAVNKCVEAAIRHLHEALSLLDWPMINGPTAAAPIFAEIDQAKSILEELQAPSHKDGKRCDPSKADQGDGIGDHDSRNG
jgi:hypothetical protein